jgi:hypothetical protein
MKRFAFLALFAVACTPPTKPPTCAEPDSSCGIDCAVQQKFGLIENRCFEYSATKVAAPIADLGVQVTKKRFELEGGVATIELTYSQSGQIKMTDYLGIKCGELYLMRRSWAVGSVTYKDKDNAITGVLWGTKDAAAGLSTTTDTNADFFVNDRKNEPTTYKVSYVAPTTDESTVPLKKYDDAIRMNTNESPDHGSDPRRVFSPGVGFILFSSTFSANSTDSAKEFRLQRIRDLGTPDAGSESCGFGTP